MLCFSRKRELLKNIISKEFMYNDENKYFVGRFVLEVFERTME